MTIMAPAKKENEGLKEKTLLVLAPFPDEKGEDISGIFVKEQIGLVKDMFKEIIVINPIPLVPGFLQGFLNELDKKKVRKADYSYGNVRVYFPQFIRAPKGLLFDFARISTIKSLIKRENLRFDIIHAHFTYPWGYYGSILKEARKRPLVVTTHGDPFRDAAKRRIGSLEPTEIDKKIFEALDSADAITTSHPELLGYLERIGYGDKSKKIDKVPLFEVDPAGPSKGLEKVVEAKKGGKHIITFIATLVGSKDPLTFVRAAKIAAAKRDDLLFVVGGEGEMSQGISKEIAKLGVQDSVVLLGLCKDRKGLMEATDIFCALGTTENIWSGTLQEAMHCGVPLIVTKAGTTEEYLKHKRTAYLIPARSPKSLASAIIEILNDKSLARRLKKNSILFAKKLWGKEGILKKWLGLYSSILNK